MNQMLKLSDKNSKAGFIKILKHSNTTSFKTCEKAQKWNRGYKKNKMGRMKLKHSISTKRKLAVWLW